MKEVQFCVLIGGHGDFPNLDGFRSAVAATEEAARNISVSWANRMDVLPHHLLRWKAILQWSLQIDDEGNPLIVKVEILPQPGWSMLELRYERMLARYQVSGEPDSALSERREIVACFPFSMKDEADGVERRYCTHPVPLRIWLTEGWIGDGWRYEPKYPEEGNLYSYYERVRGALRESLLAALRQVLSAESS